MDAKETGFRIAESRKMIGLTQKELADKLHVSAAAVSKWERGLNFPDLALIEPLAAQLHITAAHLLGLENEPAEQVIRQVMQVSQQGQRRIKWDRVVLLCVTCLLLAALILPLAFFIGWDALFARLYHLNVLNLAALTLGFAGWIAAGCGLFHEAKKRLAYVCISLACCVLALYVPTLIVDLEFRFGSWATVEDTIAGYHFGALTLMAGMALLNGIGWKRKQKSSGGA